MMDLLPVPATKGTDRENPLPPVLIFFCSNALSLFLWLIL